VPRPPGMGARRPAGGGTSNSEASSKRIWVLRDGAPAAVAVSAGASDGKRTEVSGKGLAEGDVVIVDQRSGAARS
jgi:HlyD family secretion protein